MEGRLHMLRQQQHSNATQQPQQRSATAAAQQCKTAAAAVAAHCNTTPWTSLAGSVQSCLSPARVTGSVGTPITTSQSSTFTLAALSSTSTDSSGVKALKRVYVTGPASRAFAAGVRLSGPLDGRHSACLSGIACWLRASVCASSAASTSASCDSAAAAVAAVACASASLAMASSAPFLVHTWHGAR